MWRNSWLCWMFCPLLAYGQSNDRSTLRERISDWKTPKVTSFKSGPYIGYQRGAFNVLELGYEGQFKRVKLIKPVTLSAHAGFNYNLFQNVLGYDMGGWGKVGRLNLTFGANAVLRTDFSNTKVGLAPVVGFKFGPLHLQTGYHFLSNRAIPMATNTFFVSLHFTFIQNRKIKVKKRN